MATGIVSDGDSPLFLGIDTGGTYTDAVLWSESFGLAAKAKALTTRHDLTTGISEAADRVLRGVDPARVKLVSMSTTLATNALVEGQGGRVGLVMIGFSEGDLVRDGLGTALGSDPVVFCPGGHDVHGNAAPLDLAPLEKQLGGWKDAVSAVSVAAYFSVRNPAHELAAMELVREKTGLPVTASHELSARLGGPRRALTTLLNARLIGMIERLIAATESYLRSRGIGAPLMMVRGDGALVSAAFAHRRPIETILSGPAASLVGARHMTGLENAIVADIGGTTTDVAILDKGRPRLDPEGATVGGYRTMVEAVAMRTHGLGGDSEAALSEGGLDPEIRLGPRRLVPLALAAARSRDSIRGHLERQLRAPGGGRLDGRFACRTGLPDRFAAGLTDAEVRLYGRIGTAFEPLDAILSSAVHAAVLDRLVARGLVQMSGFTPTDAAHVLGLQSTWDATAAELGAALFARRKDGRGKPIADDAETLSGRIVEAVRRRSAETILETVFAEDGIPAEASLASPLVQRALNGTPAIAGLSLTLDRPLVGLGASAPLYHSTLGTVLGTQCLVPPDTDIANALGAVAGQVRVSAEARISRPVEDVFRLNAGETLIDFVSEAEALLAAENTARALVQERAGEAGADAAEIEISRDIKTATIEGNRTFIEAVVLATATGRPRIAAE